MRTLVGDRARWSASAGAYRLAQAGRRASRCPPRSRRSWRRASTGCARGQAPAPGGRGHRQGRAVRAAAGDRGDAARTSCGRRSAQLQAAEFLYEARLFPDLEYTFKHALTHEVAYGSVLAERRRALHAAIVEAIERIHADRLAGARRAARPSRRASAAAARTRRAISGRPARRRSRARRRARRSRSSRRRCASSTSSGDTRDNLSAALDVCIALGPAQNHRRRRGGAAGGSGTYRRALELVERLGRHVAAIPGPLGAVVHQVTRSGRYAEARDAGQRLLEEAQSGDDSGRLLEAHHAMWPTLLAMGETTAAVPARGTGHRDLPEWWNTRRRRSSTPVTTPACVLSLSGCDRPVAARVPGARRGAHARRRAAVDELRAAVSRRPSYAWMAAPLQYQRGRRAAAAVRTAQRVSEIAEAHDIRHLAGPPQLFRRTVTHGTGLSAAELGEMHRRLIARGQRRVAPRLHALPRPPSSASEAGHPGRGPPRAQCGHRE